MSLREVTELNPIRLDIVTENCYIIKKRKNIDSEQRAFAEQTNFDVISDYLRESKTVLESGFHVVDSGFFV